MTTDFERTTCDEATARFRRRAPGRPPARWSGLLGTGLACWLLGAPFAAPPAVADEPSRVEFRFGTGGDDLRGGNDNLNLLVSLRSGAVLSFPNVNASRRWADNSTQTFTVELPSSVRVEDVTGVVLETTSRGSLGRDNWNLDRLIVTARAGGTTRSLLRESGRPLVRFTGERPSARFGFVATPREVVRVYRPGETPPPSATAGGASVRIVEQKRVAPVLPALAPEFRGFTNCAPGSFDDCNPCSNDVAGQFRRFAANRAQWKTKAWRFEWGKPYPPGNILRPFDTFDEDGGWSDAVGASYSHPQGFVRTNSERLPYAGSHSMRVDKGKLGSVFVIAQDGRGKKWLSSLHGTYGRHPSGVHVLGKYLFFGDYDASMGTHFLRWLDIDAEVLHESAQVPMSGAPFGGGLGIARLAAGGYLLLSSTPGDRDTRPRTFDFYRVTGQFGDAGVQVQHINNSTYVNPEAWRGKNYAPSENVSLVTECGSGDIYAIHTSGDGAESITTAGGMIGGGYWRLSKLTGTGGALQLTPIDIFVMPQSTGDCHLRSAATVGVFQDKLEFLCIQYRKDPDPTILGTILNPLSGIRVTGGDAFRFRAGVLR